MISSNYYNLIEADWCIYASLDSAIIGTNNGLSPLRYQAYIWTTKTCRQMETVEQHTVRFQAKCSDFLPENAFENVVCKM